MLVAHLRISYVGDSRPDIPLVQIPDRYRKNQVQGKRLAAWLQPELIHGANVDVRIRFYFRPFEKNVPPGNLGSGNPDQRAAVDRVLADQFFIEVGQAVVDQVSKHFCRLDTGDTCDRGQLFSRAGQLRFRLSEVRSHLLKIDGQQ